MLVWLSWAVGGALILFAALLIAWALFWDRARGRRRCPGRTFSRCWYDMRATDGLRCPECGRVWRTERQLHRTRRRWGWAWVGLLLLCCGCFSPTARHPSSAARWKQRSTPRSSPDHFQRSRPYSDQRRVTRSLISLSMRRMGG